MVIGLQETRTRSTWSGRIGGYLMVTTESENGSYGTELWFHYTLNLNDDNINRLHGDPRLRLQADHFGYERYRERSEREKGEGEEGIYSF